jgi:hypothetical protein
MTDGAIRPTVMFTAANSFYMRYELLIARPIPIVVRRPRTAA